MEETSRIKSLLGDDDKSFLKNTETFTDDQLKVVQRFCNKRCRILYFLQRVSALNVKDKVGISVNKRGELHLTDCAWSDDNATCGPDTCHCYLAIPDPDKYLRNKYGIGTEEEERTLIERALQLRRKRLDMCSIFAKKTL